jgi:hypothetical protein
MQRVIIYGMSLALGLALMPALAPGTVALQGAAPQAQEDSRWLPWLGCWEPAGETPEDGAEILVCVQPVAGGVEISTLADGEVMGVERIQADGAAQPAAEGGCEGTREARWSADSRRVYVLSDLRCAEGVHRTTSGVFSITGGGENWTEIHAVRSGDRQPVLAVRSFHPASPATLARHDHTLSPELDHRDLAIRTARMAAASALDVEDVQEAVDLAGAELASALVVEMGYGFDLDAATLRALSEQGMPADVMDMMVAVTWPERFQIEAGHPELEVQTAARDDRRRYRPWPGSVVGLGYGRSFRSCGIGARFCYDPFYHGLYSFGSPFGAGYWGPGFFPGGVRYVYVTPPQVRDRGRVSPAGYTSGGGTARPAHPGRAGTSQPSPSTQQAPRPAREPAADRAGPTRSAPTVSPPSRGSSDDRRPARRRGGGGDGI